MRKSLYNCNADGVDKLKKGYWIGLNGKIEKEPVDIIRNGIPGIRYADGTERFFPDQKNEFVSFGPYGKDAKTWVAVQQLCVDFPGDKGAFIGRIIDKIKVEIRETFRSRGKYYLGAYNNYAYDRAQAGISNLVKQIRELQAEKAAR